MMYTNNIYPKSRRRIHLTNNLAQALSRIISEKEKDNYVCTIVTINIPEHTEEVFHSPLDGYNSYGGGLNALSGAQIAAFNEKYGSYSFETIPEQKHFFFVVMKSDKLDAFSKLSFNSVKTAKELLECNSVFYDNFSYLWDPLILTRIFPYLKPFFNYLNKWSPETGKFKFEPHVLENAIKEVCN